MTNLRFSCLLFLCALVCGNGAIRPAAGQERQPLTIQQKNHFEIDLSEIGKRIHVLQHSTKHDRDFVVDVSLFEKALQYALHFDHEFSATDIAQLRRTIELAENRIDQIGLQKFDPAQLRGRNILGYTSQLDGSVQPYGIVVPTGYVPAKPIRLDVVLHGSMQPVGMSEVRFMARFDPAAIQKDTELNPPYIELHPLGRVENCYRWAGETDVFEAIEDVCRRFNIDRKRIVLRGMSMGASGTWHLGLKHPDTFVALGPYCGYVDTHRFSETPLASFVKVGHLPKHQELGLHMLDSVDYAANAGVVPVVACMGEKDIFFDAHVIMGEAMRREGLELVNLISPGTGHVVDPVTHAEQMRRIAEYATQGLNNAPPEVRFVTWTLKYNRCHWVELLGLDRHYHRAEIAARRDGERVEVTKIENINRFALLTGMLPALPKQLHIGDDTIAFPNSLAEASQGFVFERINGHWKLAGDYFPNAEYTSAKPVKRPGLQGPIDDAFSTPFLCVRGTGRPWNDTAEAYAKASLARFTEDWQRYFRGNPAVKNDTEVTAEDLKTKNLILFGDPGSNSLIARVQDELPLTWTMETIEFAGQKYSSADHIPAMIFPNPIPGSERRYIVLNTGHTFHAAELGKLNYLLFPRWGDWAILNFDADSLKTGTLSEVPVKAGYFNERWQVEE